jgi:hypothetical protein
MNIIHAIKPSDSTQRLHFANVMLQKINIDPSFFDKVLWTDEAGFNLDGTKNKQNTRHWSVINPNFTVERRMKSFQVNVWAGIWSGGIVGPFIFNGTISARSYLEMLRNEIIPAIRAIPNYQDLWFMQDGAAPHFARTIRNYLDQEFPDRWIGRGGAIIWPARSPDLTPMDFSVWGIIKDRVYAQRPATLQDLQNQIQLEFSHLSIQYCEKTCHHVICRLEKCIATHGNHIEPYL